MWPLSLILLLAAAAPQQTQSYAFKPELNSLRVLGVQAQRTAPRSLQQSDINGQQRNLCFTMRSYFFHRQDGQAPVMVGTATCTPANMLQQRRVSPTLDRLFVPLGLQAPM